MMLNVLMVFLPIFFKIEMLIFSPDGSENPYVPVLGT